jgi:8-oxo-dGTP pyrophosphatase MutT (NUDIX family)
MDKNWVTILTEEFKKPLPGVEAQLKMSPLMKQSAASDLPLKKSAVLLLLYPHEETIYTLFIKRTLYNGIHSGQISLPGGMFEKTDGALSNTALREAKEETGMPVKEAKIIGKLTCLHISVSNISVFPFVAVCNKRPDFIPDSIEVQYIIETRLDELFNPLNHKNMIMQIAGSDITVPCFDIQGNSIWGATAMIVSEFLEVVKIVTSNKW